jgi:hypothetical protein
LAIASICKNCKQIEGEAENRGIIRLMGKKEIVAEVRTRKDSSKGNWGKGMKPKMEVKLMGQKAIGGSESSG